MASRAVPIVYASGSGTPEGVLSIPTGGPDTEIELWFDADEDYYDFSLSLMAESGLALNSFLADVALDPIVSFTPGDSGTLILIDSTSLSIRSGPVRVGSLMAEGSLVGAQLKLMDLPSVISPSFTNALFDTVEIPSPQVVAQVVPEPGTALLVGLGLAITAYRRPRSS